MPPVAAQARNDPFFGTCTSSTQWHYEQMSVDHVRLTGQVQVECPQMAFFADDDGGVIPELRIVATGNVVFTNPEGRLAAERVDFNVVKGTVFSTSPPASCRSAKKSTARSLAIRSPRSIYGDTIEKLGQRIPVDLWRSPHASSRRRWEVTSDSVVLTRTTTQLLETRCSEKEISMLYLPLLYYPIKSDDRATGFLLPRTARRRCGARASATASSSALDRARM